MAGLSRRPRNPLQKTLPKVPTGITGLDEVLRGGLPRGRPTLLCGSAGSGKTLFAMEFLVRGATNFDEPGVFMAFEETEQDLAQNVVSLGFDLKKLVARRKIALDYVRIERSEISETGEYDLEALFIRLDHAIETIDAKRVVLDTIEALFAGLPSEAILRAELRRLFSWLKEKELTAIITGERGEGTLTRYGLEEYVADCVILLDHRISHQVSTRRLRVVKYRGSLHGTNEYPFLIGNHGISVMPITSLGLNHPALTERVSTGIPGLDDMFGGKGYYRGSTILISGTAGTGKTSLAAAFARSACRHGEHCLYFAFEESQGQILRNMRSIGIDLATCTRAGTLRFHPVRPTIYGLELHLTTMHDLIREFEPRIVVIDPLTNLLSVGNKEEVKAMLTRLIDLLKVRQITALFTSLTLETETPEETAIGISSLMDTWILLRNLEQGGERNRGLYVLKSRGMAHSNQVREFQLSRKGMQLVDVSLADGVVLTGTARLQQAARQRAEVALRRANSVRLQRAAARKKRATDAQIAVLRSSLEDELDELKQVFELEAAVAATAEREAEALARTRMLVSSAKASRRGRQSFTAGNRHPRPGSSIA